jgi:hypothetical protein
MDLNTAVAILCAVAAIGFPLLARRDVLTKLEAQNQSREEWRQQVMQRLASLEDRKQSNDLVELKAMDKQREQAWWDWRRDVDKRLGEIATAPYRLTQLEHQHAEYKDWKHAKADPYIVDYASLERRVQRIERYLNGKLTT